MLWEGDIAYTDKISGMFSQADTQTPPEQNTTMEDLVLCLLTIEHLFVPAFGLILAGRGHVVSLVWSKM